MIRDTVGYGMFLGVYESVMQQMVPEGGSRKDVSFGATLAVACTFGQTYWWAAMPFDTIKARLQSDSTRKPVYRNTIDCVKLVLQQSGTRGLYQGLFATCLYAVPKNGAKLLGFEIMARYVFNL
jgi:solute carrier family 25 (mitochondrial carnitine/acylcarnitine transporter), member 20/29